MKEFTKSAILTYFTIFSIPVSQEQNLAAKFHSDWPGSLAGEIEMGDGWIVHDDDTLSGIPIPDKLKINIGVSSVLCVYF